MSTVSAIVSLYKQLMKKGFLSCKLNWLKIIVCNRLVRKNPFDQHECVQSWLGQRRPSAYRASRKTSNTYISYGKSNSLYFYRIVHFCGYSESRRSLRRSSTLLCPIEPQTDTSGQSCLPVVHNRDAEVKSVSTISTIIE